MKRYLIVAENRETKPVFSDALTRAKEYAIQMSEEVPEGTPIHIFCHHSHVTKSVVWSSTLTKNKPNCAAQTVSRQDANTPKRSHKMWTANENALLAKMLANKNSYKEIASALNRTEKAVSVHLAKIRRNGQ